MTARKNAETMEKIISTHGMSSRWRWLYTQVTTAEKMIKIHSQSSNDPSSAPHNPVTR